MNKLIHEIWEAVMLYNVIQMFQLSFVVSRKISGLKYEPFYFLVFLN